MHYYNHDIIKNKLQISILIFKIRIFILKIMMQIFKIFFFRKNISLPKENLSKILFYVLSRL